MTDLTTLCPQAGIVHWSHGPVYTRCGAKYALTSADPGRVNCPACRMLMRVDAAK